MTTISQDITELCGIVATICNHIAYSPGVDSDDRRMYREAAEQARTIAYRMNEKVNDLLHKENFYDTLHRSANQEGDR